MDSGRVDLVLKFALAVAGQEDDWNRRELGPIHLLKYVYLADLAWAERHHGETYTGASWSFYKFGPWSIEVHQRIEPVVADLQAVERTIQSNTGDDFKRWKLSDARLLSTLDDRLPLAITSAVKTAVHKFGDDTSGLLTYVYSTRPMLAAAPGERLDFTVAIVAAETPPPSYPEEPSAKTVKAKKKETKRLEEVRRRVAEALKRDREREQVVMVPASPAPRYDATFIDGVEWLDNLAGESSLVPERGHLQFSPLIWKSPARNDGDDE